MEACIKHPIGLECLVAASNTLTQKSYQKPDRPGKDVDDGYQIGLLLDQFPDPIALFTNDGTGIAHRRHSLLCREIDLDTAVALSALRRRIVGNR